MKKNKENFSSEMEMGNLVKIILIILAVFGIFYVFTYYLQTYKKVETNNSGINTITTIQYDEILMGDLLNQSETEYYVLLVKKTDYDDRYKEYLTKYSNNNKFYYSLIDNGLNSSYVSDVSNLNVNSIQDLKVSDTSLLKINSGKIILSYDGNASVMQAIIDINK